MTFCLKNLIWFLSGVNKGNNAAENTLYSGTIGAAIEGGFGRYNPQLPFRNFTDLETLI